MKAERIYQGRRIILNAHEEVSPAFKADRVFADESSEFRVVVSGSVVIGADLSAHLLASDLDLDFVREYREIVQEIHGVFFIKLHGIEKPLQLL